MKNGNIVYSRRTFEQLKNKMVWHSACSIVKSMKKKLPYLFFTSGRGGRANHEGVIYYNRRMKLITS